MSTAPANTPDELINKLKTAVESQKRAKKITFRVTNDTYEELETMARLSGANLSRVMEIITKEHLQLLKTKYENEGVEE